MVIPLLLECELMLVHSLHGIIEIGGYACLDRQHCLPAFDKSRGRSWGYARFAGYDSEEFGEGLQRLNAAATVD